MADVMICPKTSSPSVHQRSSECEPQGRDCHGKQCYDCICLPLCDKCVAKTNLLTFLASLTKDQLQHFSTSHLWSQRLWTCSLPPQQWHSAGPSWVISEELKFTSNSLLVDQSKSGATLQAKGNFLKEGFHFHQNSWLHHFLSRTYS